MTAPALDVVVLRSEDGDVEAAFIPSAGMVCASLLHHGEELLGQRDGIGAYVDRAATMGIPLLHPWANRLSADAGTVGEHRFTLPADAAFVPRDERGLAIHGLHEPAAWAVEGGGPGRITARRRFSYRDEVLAAFPFPHDVVLDATLSGATLRIRTTIVPTAGRAVPVAFGFHPHLRLPGLPRADWVVTLPAMIHLELDGAGLPAALWAPTQERCDRLGARTHDDAFAGVAPGAEFTVAGGGRSVTVRFEDGFPFAQVYAPRYDDVVSFEPMTACVDALVSGKGLRTVGPGERFTATFSLTVRDT